MADLAAIREARRKKILQNSESRMNRLLGIIDKTTDEAQQGNGNKQLTTDSENNLFAEGEGLETSHSNIPEELTEFPSYIKSSDLEVNSSFLPGTVHQRPGHRFSSEVNAPEDQPYMQRQQQPSHILKNTVPSDSGHRAQSSVGTMDDIKILDLMRAGGCMLVAFVTRWSLSFGLGLIFLEWALLPFIILEGSLYYFQNTYMKDVKLPHSSSITASALILCGVKSDVIISYNRIMGHMNAVTEDFAIYLFTFLIFNALMV